MNQLGKVGPNNPAGCQGYFGKVEIIGLVTPSNASGSFVLKQTRDYYLKLTFTDGSPPQINQGSIVETFNYQQDVPNSNGNIFAIDGPGFATIGYPIDTAWERQNFTVWAEYNGVQCSNNLEWHNQTTITTGFQLGTPTDVGPGHISLAPPP